MATQRANGAQLAGPREQILVALSQLGESHEEGLSAAELGKRLDLHPTTIRFHAQRLRTAGLVRQHDIRHEGAGRPARKYTLAPKTALTASALESIDRANKPAEPAAPLDSPGSPHGLLAGVLVRAAGADGLTPAQAGRAWAGDHLNATPPTSWRAATEQVADLLQEWGYHVTLDGPAGEEQAVDVTFAGCPFESLARANPQVVCGVHHGLVEGALSALGQSESQVRLFPFSTPATCRARLTPTPE